MADRPNGIIAVRVGCCGQFYEWFMGFGQREWGMVSFEPDFMVENNICVDEFLSSHSAAEQWMGGMAAAAASRNVPMQWCMASPSDLLMALKIPAVTNLRASTDYYYGSSWNVGHSSLLICACCLRCVQAVGSVMEHVELCKSTQLSVIAVARLFGPLLIHLSAHSHAVFLPQGRLAQFLQR